MDRVPTKPMICQMRDPFDPRLTCEFRESGGIRCEVDGPHTVHRIGNHSIFHSRAGNGYSCSYIDECPDPYKLTPFTTINPWR